MLQLLLARNRNDGYAHDLDMVKAAAGAQTPLSATPSRSQGDANAGVPSHAPLVQQLSFEMLGGFDDAALRVFLDPSDGGADPYDLARACTGGGKLTERLRSNLPTVARRRFEEQLKTAIDIDAVMRARADVVATLFWPLVYWHMPDEYDELVSGERIHPDLLTDIDMEGRLVCDIGAGTGRFTLYAAGRAKHVVAVDAVPPLLQILQRKLIEASIGNISIRRGSFNALPLDDGTFDVAVACSAFTTRGPQGGERALSEAERIVKSGGEVVVIWPTDPEWFQQRGYTYRSYQGNDLMHFADVDTAARLCGRFYSAEAAAWVRDHNTAEVPYSVLGTKPPNDVCIKRVVK